MTAVSITSSFFFFNDTATTEIYTLSLHDALPICSRGAGAPRRPSWPRGAVVSNRAANRRRSDTRDRLESAPRRCRSEEHTSELQSLAYLVCRLLLEKKKQIPTCTARLTARIPRYG